MRKRLTAEVSAYLVIGAFVIIGIATMFAWALYSGSQVEQCIWLTHKVIVCGDGWRILDIVS